MAKKSAKKTIETLTDDLEDYDTSKGAIRFPPGKPLPVSLLRKLIKARIAEEPSTSRGHRLA